MAGIEKPPIFKYRTLLKERKEILKSKWFGSGVNNKQSARLEAIDSELDKIEVKL